MHHDYLVSYGQHSSECRMNSILRQSSTDRDAVINDNCMLTVLLACRKGTVDTDVPDIKELCWSFSPRGDLGQEATCAN